MNTRISIIIPCFNGEKYLKYAIESVLNQTQKVDQIIIVDDGSSDTTKKVAISFPEVTYLYHDNQGVSFSRNRGLKACTSEYVIFLDADDVLPSNRVKEDCSLLDEDTEIGYVFGWFSVIDEDGNIRDGDMPESIINAGYHTILEGRATVSPGSVTFRVTCLKQLESVFDKKISAAEDFDLYLRFSRLFPIHCSNRIALYYRRHQNNCSTSNGGIKTLKSMLKRLDEQKQYTRNDISLSKSLEYGRNHWKNLLGPRCVGEFIMRLKEQEWKVAAMGAIVLFKCCPRIFMDSIIQRIFKRVKLK